MGTIYLTKQADSVARGGQLGAQIEITPAMIEAGVSRLMRLAGPDLPSACAADQIVREVLESALFASK